jgi:hypothetical protein
MLKKIGIGLVVVLAVLLAVVATRPADYRVERSLVINAPAEVVFAQVNDFHKWDAWSPWDKLDPKQTKTHEGAAAGVGAIYKWAGNDQVGEGRMTITESAPAAHVGVKLEFLKPWEATSEVDFTFKPAPGGVTAVWGMNGHNTNLGAKAASLFMDMDAMLGKDFEAGLAGLKKVSEAEAQKRAEEAKKAEAAAPAAAPQTGTP